MYGGDINWTHNSCFFHPRGDGIDHSDATVEPAR